MGLTRALALELAQENVTVVGISPGPFATEMNTTLMQNPEINRQFLASIPVGRWGKVEDIGSLAVFLCSDAREFPYRHGHPDRWRLVRAMRLVALALLIPLLISSGCNRSRRKRIAVIPKATSHLFWVSVQNGALAAGKEFGVDILWNGPALETEYARQIQIVDSMIAQHVDGIAIAAAERKALVSAVDRAMAAKIPVTVFDSGLESTNYMTFVATDNYLAGQEAARALAGLLDGKGKIGIVMQSAGSQSTVDRERGFEEVIVSEFPQIKIVGRQYGRSDPAVAMAAAENILTAHPDLAGLFASSEPSSLGFRAGHQVARPRRQAQVRGVRFQRQHDRRYEGRRHQRHGGAGPVQDGL